MLEPGEIVEIVCITADGRTTYPRMQVLEYEHGLLKVKRFLGDSEPEIFNMRSPDFVSCKIVRMG